MSVCPKNLALRGASWDARKNDGARECALKVGATWCRDGNARKIMVHT
jgi:hypothetical protein